MIKNKCDVIIPIYNAPDWTKLCVYAVMQNTSRECLNKIYLMNDNSNAQTLNMLLNLKDKYGDVIELITNENNLGFVKNCNKALKLAEAEYVLLLNSDCLLSKNSIQKLMNHMQKDEKIGLICPVASNAANLTLPIFEGFSYSDMDKLLESKFSGECFDACTIVGNCLMIKNECLSNVGLLDEIYGMGYGEETDYQFKCMEAGYSAKVAIDTYVFHKAEVSFGVSEEKQKRLNYNRDIFFSRWEKQYNELLEEYNKHDPIKYILENITESDKQPAVDVLFYLPDIVQNAGGCHVVVDMVNYLSINGVSANVTYDSMKDYKEIMVFTPISSEKMENIDCNKIVATIWYSVFRARKFADSKHIPLVYFVQGYEPYFCNGVDYGLVALSYKIPDQILTISDYLSEKMLKMFDKKSTVIPNGINYDLLYNRSPKKHAKSITMIMRGNPMKGDFILLDLLKQINDNNSGLEINFVYVENKLVLPELVNHGNVVNIIKGPISRNEVTTLLEKTDIYIDCSLNEGFGLIGLEALFARAVPIVSNSFGIHEYIIDGVNGFIVDNVNDSQKYYDKIQILLNDDSLYSSMSNQSHVNLDNSDYDNSIQKLIAFLSNVELKKEKDLLSDYEKELLVESTRRFVISHNKRFAVRFAESVSEKLPNKIKKFFLRIGRILIYLYDKE